MFQKSQLKSKSETRKEPWIVVNVIFKESKKN